MSIVIVMRFVILLMVIKYILAYRLLLCCCCGSGGSLDKHRNIPEHILGPISVSIVRGLQYLWSLKIMHRGLIHGFVC